jgi:ABC-2 type transport system ATP-binding protein
MYAIELDGLTKRFGDLVAVNGVSLNIKAGQIFGLLGPNGAGKTTLISMLVTMKKPTSGSARVNGFDIAAEPDKTRRSIGIVFQDPSLDEELTAFENLELHAAMYGLGPADRKKRIHEVIEMVELSERVNDVVKTFSGGMRRRLEIARGLLHYPKILFLDEPTIGLDPQTRNHVWEYIKKLKKEHGITVVMTTHYMDEADSLCDMVGIIDHGRIMALDTPAALKDSLGGDIISMKSEDSAAMEKAAKKLEWVKGTKMDDGSLSIRVEQGEKRILDLMDVARAGRIIITSISMHKPTLDDVFLHYTGSSIRAEAASAKDSMRIRRNAWRKSR